MYFDIVLHDSIHTCIRICAEIVAKKPEVLFGQVKANMTKKLWCYSGGVTSELNSVVRSKVN